MPVKDDILKAINQSWAKDKPSYSQVHERMTKHLEKMPDDTPFFDAMDRAYKAALRERKEEKVRSVVNGMTSASVVHALGKRGRSL